MASETQALLADGKLAGSWTLDGARSSVGLRTKSVWGLVKVKGVFGQVAGEAVISAAGEATGTITVSAASLDTGNKKRDDHLRSADFFDAAQYPELRFESTKIEALDDEEFRITGQLTIHGVTNEIVLHADVLGTDTDPYGNERVGLEVTGKLSRGDYGMKFNQALGSGNMLVGDKVNLALDISAVKQAA
jgi:polyisoprenoid-binding protein YceI